MKRVFIDGGANIGSSIEMFLDQYPEADKFEIHSFEANAKLHNILKSSNYKATIYNKALYVEDTILDFYLGGDLSSTIRTDKTSGNIRYSDPVKVETIDLARFIKSNFTEEDYIVLKLDVEGAEYDILPHLIKEGIFNGWVNELFGEWHEHKLDNISRAQHNELVSQLQDRGFKMKEWAAESNIIEL